MIEDLTRKVGAAKSFTQVTDRSSLLKLLPQSQDELPPRRMVVRIVALDLSGLLLHCDFSSQRDSYVDSLFCDEGNFIQILLVVEDLSVFSHILQYGLSSNSQLMGAYAILKKGVLIPGILVDL